MKLSKFQVPTFLPSIEEALFSAYIDFGFYPKRYEVFSTLQLLEQKAWPEILFLMEFANLRFDYDAESHTATLHREGYYAASELKEIAERAEWAFLREQKPEDVPEIYGRTKRAVWNWLNANRLPQVKDYRGLKCRYKHGYFLVKEMKNNNHYALLGGLHNGVE